jgi:acyl carrier protein
LEQSAESFQKVYAAKALAAWNLHKHCPTADLDFFVMFSSVASLIGSPGQGNYCAANAYLDALSRERSRRGLPGMSIQWGAFAEVGLAAARDIRGKRLSYRGGGSIAPAEGWEAFRRLLAAPRAEIGIVRLDFRQWVEFFPSTAGIPFFAEVIKEAASRQRSTAQTREFRETLRAVQPQERLQMLERHLAEHVGVVLHVDSSRIDQAVPLQTIGLDSLMGLELRNRLEATLGLRLSATMLFKYSSIAALAPVLLADLGLDAPPALSNDKADVPVIKADKDFEKSVAEMAEDEAEALLLSKLAARRVKDKR